MKISKYIFDDAQYFIREAIADAGGNEVFVLGKTNNKRVVESAEVIARGNAVEVPAITRICRTGDVVIHNHPSGVLKPSSADNRIASYLGNEGIGFYIVNNEVTDIYVSIEPIVHEEPVAIDLNKIKPFIEPNGAIAKILPSFETREPQLQMLADVVEAFNHNKVALIEAGTGTGKTLAYLLPAIQWSIENRKRLVISTNTINLQQQLVEKDIPLIQNAYPKKFDAALVKGRSNYVCLRKLHEAVGQPTLLDIGNAKQELEQIFAWAKKTKDGSKSDLGTLPGDRVWEQIQSESDTTLKNRCEFYNKCFFYNARRKAASADILVANHHLLFADLAIRSVAGNNASEIAVMPKYERLILDEAHNIEDVASSYFGVRISYLGIQRTLNRLFRVKDNKETGQITFLQARIQFRLAVIPRDLAYEIDRACDSAKEKIEQARVNLSDTMERLFFFVGNQDKSKYSESKLRLTERIYQNQNWKAIIEGVPALLRSMYEVASVTDKILTALSKIPTSFEKEARSLAVDLKAQADRLTETAGALKMVLQDKDEVNVRWLEVRESRFGNIVRLYTAPIDVAPILQKAVFEKFPTVVMTSATLSVGKSFEYIDQRLGLAGLKESRKIETILPSPFDFQQQAIVGIPTDIPEPNSASFSQKLPELLKKGIAASNGRAFVLFTAYSLLNKMFNELEYALKEMNIALYKQGQENRHQLLNRFRTDISSVLFATDSFWEGVDVPGEALMQVIIPRLPFRVPSEPVIEARVEAIDKSGGNSFMEYSVPQAVLKFKQGFGRLIRNRSDYGAILLLDNRVVSKHYGRLFLASLPECNVVVGTADEVFASIAAFLGR
jgi:ATP-dependent DNA helicase DinG